MDGGIPDPERAHRERASLAQRLLTETTITKAVATTSEGDFIFDIRDNAVGWTLARGNWEAIETALFKQLVTPGDLVIDGGANLGWYSVLAAKLVGPSGLVLAFEPEPRNFALLASNLALHRVAERTRCYQLALFDRTTELDFELSGSNFGDHRVRNAGAVEHSPAHLYGEQQRTTTQVPARTLDDVLGEAGLGSRPIRLLKLDTQGSEVSILRGASVSLPRIQYLISEFWPYGIQRTGNRVDEYVAIVASQFGSFARLGSPNIVMRPIADFARDAGAPADNEPGSPVQYSDYFFSK